MLSSRTETLRVSSREKALIMSGPPLRMNIAKMSRLVGVGVRTMTTAKTKIKNKTLDCILIVRMINVRSLLLMSLLTKDMPKNESFLQIPKMYKNLSLHKHHQPDKRQHLSKNPYLHKNPHPFTSMRLNQSLRLHKICYLCISQCPSKNVCLSKSRKLSKSQ